MLNLDAHMEYVESHTEEISKYVDSCIEASKDLFRAKIVHELRKCLIPLPSHYEWRHDGTKDVADSIKTEA